MTLIDLPSFYMQTIKKVTIQKTEEKLYFQPKDLFEVVDFTNMGVVEEPRTMIPKFVIGEKYALKGIACDGFEMQEKIYELVGVVDNFHGVKIDSVIVKQVGGEKGLVFTLSKNDCIHLGIKYQKGLQLFPKKLDWKRVEDFVAFDKNNLGTMPLSKIDNTVRNIMVKLNGFKDYFDGYILTPSGCLIKEKQFESSIRIQTVEPLVYGNGLVVRDKTNLNIELAYPNGMLFNHANFITSDNEIYILIKLAKHYLQGNTIDGNSGVERKYLEGLNPNEYFTISWNELGAVSVEEYEAAKEKKRKEEEAERQRKIDEYNRLQELKKTQTEKMVKRMKDYGIKKPTIPRIPNLEFDGKIDSVGEFTNRLDIYIKSVNTSLSNLMEDLDMIGKVGGIKSPSIKHYGFYL